jgi:uncharacterized protein
MSYKSPYELKYSHELAPSTSENYFPIEVRTISEGFSGAFSAEFIPRGATIARDGGVVVSSIDDVLSDKNYVALIGDGLWLAPKDYEQLEPIFFLNHSCTSNVARYGGLVYVAKRDIAAGEQLTIDYAPLVSGFRDWSFQCLCRSPVCRVTISSHDWENPAIAAQLWPEWLPFIQRKILSQRAQLKSSSSMP